jgi:ketosteroid isomerase-like protein
MLPPGRYAGGDERDAAAVVLLERMLAAFNRHDLEAILACFAQDAVLEIPRGRDPWGARYVGKAAIRAGLATRFAGIPDVRYDEARHRVCGDRGVAEGQECTWSMSSSPFGGLKRSPLRTLQRI